MNSISTSCNSLRGNLSTQTQKSSQMDSSFVIQKSIQFCFISFQELIGDKLSCFSFPFLLFPDLSSCHPTLHYQVPKTHEQNQIQNPKQIPDRIKCSPLARSSLELQHVLLLHQCSSDITRVVARNHTHIKSDPISLA